MMNTAIGRERPCSISESIVQSCKEAKMMWEGKMPKRNLGNLFSDIDRWVEGEAVSFC